MNSNWLKFVLAAFFSAAVFVAPGCGGGDDDDDDDTDTDNGGGTGSTDETPGVLSPIQGPVGQSVAGLEECSGLDLSQAQELLDLETDLADGLVNRLLAFELEDGGDVTDLIALGNILGDEDGDLTSILEGITPLLDDLAGQGVLDADVGGSLSGAGGEADAGTGGTVTIAQQNDVDAINNLTENILGDLDAGLPGGVDQLVSELTQLSALLEGLELEGTPEEILAGEAALDAIAGVLGEDANLIGAIGGLDSEGAGSALTGIVDELMPLATDCAGTVNDSLEDPAGLVMQTLQDSNLPLIDLLFTTLGSQLEGSGFGFEQILSGLIGGDLESVGGVPGLEGLLSGGELDVLRGNLGMLGDLLGPLAGLDEGGLSALDAILDAEGGLDGFTGWFHVAVQRDRHTRRGRGIGLRRGRRTGHDLADAGRRRRGAYRGLAERSTGR
jgi:hypothetical protein